jgi:hypothetical protein
MSAFKTFTHLPIGALLCEALETSLVFVVESVFEMYFSTDGP